MREFKQFLKFDPRLQLKTTEFNKEDGEWVKRRSHLENVERANFFNVYNSIPFFESLGGTESVEFTDDSAIFTSLSPNKETKIIREYYIID